MSTNAPVFNDQDDSLEQKQQTRRLLFRIMPYAPVIILALIFGAACSYFYLRYATRTYEAKTRLIVNDDTQEKNANLLEIMQLDTRNLSAETEREMQILSSRDLLSKLVAKMQLNVQYNQKGFVRSGQYFKNVPFELTLQNPDTVDVTMAGEVDIINNGIRFNGITYPVDTFVPSRLGNIRWHINSEYKSSETNKWFVSVQPIPRTVDIMQNTLTIKPITKQSSILELSYIDAIPDRGVNILNSLISLYGVTTIDYKSRISANTLAFLDGRIRLVSEDLNEVEKNLQTFKSKEGIVDLGAEGTLFLDQVKETDTKIGDISVQMDVLKEIEQYVTRRNNTNSPIPATLGSTDPILIGLLTQLYQAEFDLEKTRQTSGSKNPQIEVYEAAIAKLKPSILSSVNNLKMGLQASLERLKGDNGKLMAALNKMPKKERMLIDISRQQEIKNTIYTFLLQKREESAIAAAAIVPNFRVIEKPEFAGMVAPIALRVYGIGLLAALMLGIIFVYFREFSNSRLQFRSQIESRLSLPIIAELSYQPSDTGSQIVVGLGNRSLIGEQFRELRTNINYITAVTNEKCKIILITSSIPGEGKSFVAINTAVSLCLTGARVVLLEFDLRKPKISKELGIVRDPGLSNYLINSASEKDIIKPHPSITNFYIIPSGPIPPNPAELISSSRLTDLIVYLKQNFDYIIIDSPPVGSVTDAKILASMAHSTLYLIRHNYTNSTFLQLINDIQHKSSLPNINIIFNGITTKKILGYSYGQGYGYGYGYGYGGYGYGYTEDEKKRSWWKRIFKKRKKA